MAERRHSRNDAREPAGRNAMIYGVRISQYVYFALRSERTTAHEMTAQLGLEPDEIGVRGSRRADPPRPVCHTWKVVCRERGLTVDEQIGRVLNRLEPHADRIAALVTAIDAAEPGITAILQVVRSFNGDDGEEEDPGPTDGGLVKLPGQHQLLGWHVDRRVLTFLQRVGAELDVDEYG
jgi:hypothetical protein